MKNNNPRPPRQPEPNDDPVRIPTTDVTPAQTRAAINRYLRACRDYERVRHLLSKIVDETATNAEKAVFMQASFELDESVQGIPEGIDLNALPAYEELS